MDTSRIRARDAAADRLRRATAIAAGASGAVALVFGVVAAKAFPGRSSHATTRPATRTTHRTRSVPRQSAPTLVGVAAQAPAPAPAPAQQTPAPVQTAAPPVAVSGGS